MMTWLVHRTLISAGWPCRATWWSAIVEGNFSSAKQSNVPEFLLAYTPCLHTWRKATSYGRFYGDDRRSVIVAIWITNVFFKVQNK